MILRGREGFRVEESSVLPFASTFNNDAGFNLVEGDLTAVK